MGGRQYLSPGLTNENIVTLFVEVRRGASAGAVCHPAACIQPPPVPPPPTPPKATWNEIRVHTTWDHSIVKHIFTPSPLAFQVDGDALEGAPPPQQALEEDESIEVELVPLGRDLEERLAGFEARGYGVWVGLHAIAQGLKLGAMFGI